MNARSRIIAVSFACLFVFLFLCLISSSYTLSRQPISRARAKDLMTSHATGPIDVTLTPLDPANKTEDNSLGRMSIDKQFHGDLEGTSKREMLTAGTGVIERVSG